MPIQANEKAHSPSQKGVAEFESETNPEKQSASSEDCCCKCDSQQEDEWETDTEELLHVEINGIFQVRTQN